MDTFLKKLFFKYLKYFVLCVTVKITDLSERKNLQNDIQKEIHLRQKSYNVKHVVQIQILNITFNHERKIPNT